MIHSVDFLAQSMEEKNIVAAQKYHHLLYSTSERYRGIGDYSEEMIKELNRMLKIENADNPLPSFLALVFKHLIDDFKNGLL